MVTVLGEYGTEEQYSILRCFFFLWAELNAKNIHKEMFPVYSRKCLVYKAVHKWVKKFSQGRSKVTDAQPGCPVEITTEAKNSVLRVSAHW
jgi:hypothetical protein